MRDLEVKNNKKGCNIGVGLCSVFSLENFIIICFCFVVATCDLEQGNAQPWARRREVCRICHYLLLQTILCFQLLYAVFPKDLFIR